MNLIKKMLAAQAAVLALWAVSAQATTTDDAIAKRLEPVGKVCVQGKECEGVGAVAAAAGGGGARSGEDIVGKTCNTCHGTGLLGAPKVGDKAEWGKRAKEQGRSDDTPEVIAKRLETYEKETAPLLDIYKQRGLLISVNGVGEIDEISNAIIAELDANVQAR